MHSIQAQQPYNFLVQPFSALIIPTATPLHPLTHTDVAPFSHIITSFSTPYTSVVQSIILTITELLIKKIIIITFSILLNMIFSLKLLKFYFIRSKRKKMIFHGENLKIFGLVIHPTLAYVQLYDDFYVSL